MLRRIFIAGLTALVPFVITVYVIIGLFQFADGFLGTYINNLLSEYIGYSIPGLGIILSLLIIFFVGLIVHLSRHKLLRTLERAVTRIPIVNKIYIPVRKIVNFLFLQEKRVFKRVVMLEYPRRGIYSLGFITNEGAQFAQDKVGKKLWSVFIPSSPSPLTGFTIIVTEEELTLLDLSVEEALKIVVSGGMLNEGD